MAVREKAEAAGVELILVAVDDTPAEAAGLAGAPEATLYDPGWRVARLWKVEGLPTTLRIEGGEEVQRAEGAGELDEPGRAPSLPG